MTDAPRISVMLPFYNSSQTVVRAARSILKQAVKDIELIAIDDGSNDDGFRTLDHLRDPRLRLYRNDRNLGVAATRNRALDLARGEFVAMMDGDDTCHPRRLEWLLGAMQADEKVGICGGWMRLHRRGVIPFVFRQPCRAQAVRAMTLYGPPFCYASIMIRHDVVKRTGMRYNERLLTGEDDDFCTRLLRHTKGVNIPRVVYHYRWNPNGLTATAASGRSMRRAESLRAVLEDLLARPLAREELAWHTLMGTGAGTDDCAELMRRRDWLQLILAANAERRIFDPEGLAESTSMIWFRICRNSAHLGRKVWHIWRDAPLSKYYRPSLDEQLGFAGTWAKSLLIRSHAMPQGGGAACA